MTILVKRRGKQSEIIKTENEDIFVVILGDGCRMNYTTYFKDGYEIQESSPAVILDVKEFEFVYENGQKSTTFNKSNIGK